MTRQWLAAVVAIVMAATLAGALLLAVKAPSLVGPVERPEISLPPEPSPTATTPRPSPTASPTAGRAGPPAGTVHVDDRYRTRHAGTYAGWDELLADGRSLPTRSPRCRTDWRTTTRDDALDWRQAGYLCLDQLNGKGFKPQGVGGSGTAQGYRIGGRPASDRHLVIVSSYSAKPQRGLLFPHQPGKTETTRLTVIDLDQRRYNTVELVRPTGAGTLTALDSHGSGMVWVGQYLYSSSRGSLWLYNADDLLRINGRYVLPAVARWSVSGTGGLSSLGVDRTTRTTRLVGITYSETGTAWSHTLELDRSGLLRPVRKPAVRQLRLTRDFGPGPGSVLSGTSSVLPGTNYQGIGTVRGDDGRRYRIANSSSLMLAGRRHGDNVVIMRKDTMIARFAMPKENIESLYLDPRRERYVTITEHGRQFLFWLPTGHLIDRAERYGG